jgi:hypothetical protein
MPLSIEKQGFFSRFIAYTKSKKKKIQKPYDIATEFSEGLHC